MTDANMKVEAAPAPRRRGIGGRIGVFFVFLLAPAIAGFIAPLIMATQSTEAGNSVGWAIFTALFGAVYTYFLTWPAALGTALVAAVVTGFIRPWWLWVISAVVIGAGVSGGMIALFVPNMTGMLGMGGVEFYALFGGLSAGVCALITQSFRPKPAPRG